MVLGNRAAGQDQCRSWLFTENETNDGAVLWLQEHRQFFKDGINDYVVNGKKEAVNPKNNGTKAAAIYSMTVPAGKSVTVRLRLYDGQGSARSGMSFAGFDEIFDKRIEECDEFYDAHVPLNLTDHEKHGRAAGVCRDALVQAVLSLRRVGLAERRSRATQAAAIAPDTGATPIGDICSIAT